MHGRLTKRLDRGAIIRYPRMRRTLPHEIIALVVFLHDKTVGKTMRDPSGKPCRKWHKCRHTHATHTSVVTSRLSESIQTSMGHSIVAYVSSLGVIWDMVRGEERLKTER